MDSAKNEALREAIASCFDQDPDAVTDFVVLAERVNGEELLLSTVRSNSTPPWRLLGFLHQALSDLRHE